MNDFKEWLSDYLRYFMLILAVLLIFALAMIGVKVYRSFNGQDAENAVVILDETEKSEEPVAESDTEKMTGAETEEMTDYGNDSESETRAETRPETERETLASTEKRSETVSSASVPETENVTAETKKTAETQKTTETQRITETESETQTETETEVYVPVYKTLKGSCYIRSGPSMDAEIIGEYMYGTTVEFLEDVGGWYKVQIDGMVGYMGARFF